MTVIDLAQARAVRASTPSPAEATAPAPVPTEVPASYAAAAAPVPAASQTTGTEPGPRQARTDRLGNGYIGRRARPVGAFRLRPGLTGPGQIRLDEAVSLACAEYLRQQDHGRIKPRTADAYRRISLELLAWAAAEAPDTLLAAVGSVEVTDYVFSANAPGSRRPGLAPEHDTMHRRRSGARALFQTFRLLGLDDRDPTDGIVLPSRENKHTPAPEAKRTAAPPPPPPRAVTDIEAEACRHASEYRMRDTRLPAACAVLLAGAGTGEASEILVKHLRLTDGMLWCPPVGRSRGRWLRLDDWAVDSLSAHVDYLAARVPADALADTAVLWVGPQRNRRTGRAVVDPDHNRQSEMVGLAARLLRHAGLDGVPEIRPGSLPEYGAVREFRRTGKVEAAATVLGISSLDAAAAIVRYDWRAACALAPDHTEYTDDTEPDTDSGLHAGNDEQEQTQ